MTQVPLPGDRFTISRTFTATAPGTLVVVNGTLHLLEPNGTDVPVTLSAATLGTTVVDGVTLGTATFTATYTVPELANVRGIWWARWKLSQDLVAVEEYPFLVGRSRFL